VTEGGFWITPGMNLMQEVFIVFYYLNTIERTGFQRVRKLGIPFYYRRRHGTGAILPTLILLQFLYRNPRPLQLMAGIDVKGKQHSSLLYSLGTGIN
jgi:hypothetical protein